MSAHAAWRLPLAISAVLSCVAPTGSALAHHSYAVFDTTKKVQITGTVVTWEWMNPHAHMQVLTVGPGGVNRVWDLVMNSPNILGRNGWTHDSVKPGDKVTVVLNPRRDGVLGGTPLTVTTADGSVLGKQEPVADSERR